MKFVLSTTCLLTASAASAAGNEDGTSLMQRRFIKQMSAKDSNDGKGSTGTKFFVGHTWEDSHYDVDDPPATEPAHVCGQWSAWSDCSASCGGGFESRTYTFDEGAKCGESCPHGDGDQQQRECGIAPCPVDCEGSFGEYTPCSATCGGGLQARTFTVTRSAAHGGAMCAKAHGAVEDHDCSTQQCEVNCMGHWDDWSECSNGGAGPHGLECGPGASQSRGYNVTKDHTSAGCGCMAGFWADHNTEVAVDASTVDTRECELPCCPEPCEGSWGAWGQCTGPNLQTMAPVVPSYGYTGIGEIEMCCGGGMKQRTFSVSSPLVCGGSSCEAGNGAIDSTTCCETPCPVDCEGEWSDPSECCSSCGGGQQERVFIITQEEKHGGAKCDHKAGDIKHEGCNEDIPCPIDCEGNWAEWEDCTDTCGPDGTQTRHWIVTVEAEHGGIQCSHLDQVQLRSCDPEPVPCPIDAVCKWTEYGECSATCFDTVAAVTITKTREWVEIKGAEHGGEECADSPPAGESDTATCHQPNCPIPCEGAWGEYDTCNAKVANEVGGGCAGDHFCGAGTKTKTYHVSQVALYGGEECPYEDAHQQSKVCGEYPCPIDCVGAYTEWGTCTADCGGASQARQFVIDVPAQYGGCECEHVEHTAHQDCNTHPCPIDCEGSWSEWGSCDQDCTDCRNSGDHGTSTREFTITVQAQYGGAECPSNDGDVEDRTCNEHCCPENCEGSWSEFGDCSTSCGNGVTARTYTITHEAAHGGNPCPYCADALHTTSCNDTSPCPIDCQGDFSGWSACSENCGGGEESAWFIQTQLAQNGGQECEHAQFELVTRSCNEDACPVMCLGAFGPYGACDADCSGGERARTFMVYRPASGGGPECSHATGDTETEACNTHDCPDGYVCPPAKTCKYSNGLIQVR